MTDIKLTSVDEVGWNDGDFDLIHDAHCEVQTIQSRLTCCIGNLFYDPNFGSQVLKFIQASQEEIPLLKAHVEYILKQHDNIESSSITINTRIHEHSILLEITFTFSDNPYIQQINLSLDGNNL